MKCALNVLRVKREGRGHNYTVGLTMESSLYSHLSETTMFSLEKNIKMLFSNETFSLPSKQEMLIFCSTATASLYRRGHQPPAPTTIQSGPRAYRKIACMFKYQAVVTKCGCLSYLLQFLQSANFSLPITAL